MIRRLLVFSFCFLAFSCSSEELNPPHIVVPFERLDVEAASAIQDAQSEAANSSPSMQSWQKLGKLLHAHGVDAQAKTAYEFANKLQQTSETTYLLALVCEDLGQYQEAIQHCESLGAYPPSLWRQGYWYLDLGEHQKAIEKFDLAIKQDSSEVAAIVGKSRVFISLGRYDDAVTLLKDVQARGGSHPYITYLLGTAYQRMGEHEVATPLLQAPMPGPPIWNDPWLRGVESMKLGFAASLTRATQKLDRGNLDGALGDLKKLHQKFPKDATVTNNLGSVYIQLGKPQEAINVIAKGLEHSPSHAPSHFSIGLALMQLQALDKAEESLLRAIEYQPAFAPAYVSLGRIALMKKDLQSARDHLERAMSIGTNNPTDRQMLGMTYLDLRLNDEAIQQFDLVLQSNQSLTMSIGGKAVALSRLGQYEDAMSLLRDANERFQNDSHIQRAMNVVINSRRPQ